jgi:CRP/FNR family cyclic AMP-dependent transcriptional regulator
MAMMNGRPELLNGLSDQAAAQILAIGSRMTVANGAELFQLGVQADRLFVVERGRIRLTLPMQVRGREENVLVEERGSGQTVGWSALNPPFRFTLSASAALETEVISFGREALLAYFAQHPEAGYVVSMNLASVIAQRLQLFQTMWLREMQRTINQHCA